MESLLTNTVKAQAFRTEYRTALAHQMKETNPETFNEFRFPDGMKLSWYAL